MTRTGTLAGNGALTRDQLINKIHGIETQAGWKAVNLTVLASMTVAQIKLVAQLRELEQQAGWAPKSVADMKLPQLRDRSNFLREKLGRSPLTDEECELAWACNSEIKAN
jgi:hypothetical protein